MGRHATTLAFLLAAALTGCNPPAADPPPTPAPVVKVLPLGDSITAGLGSTTGAGYRLPLWNRVAAQDRYRIDYVGSQTAGALPDPQHEGHRGWFIRQVRAEVDGWLATSQPDVVLLHIGINDLAWGADPLDAAGQLTDLVQRIRADRPGVTILLLGLIPASGDPGLRAKVALYNEQARSIGGAHYVQPPALAAGEMVDELHPSDAGYERLADAFYLKFSALGA